MKNKSLASLAFFLGSSALFAQEFEKSTNTELLGGYSVGVEVAPSFNLHVVEYDDLTGESPARACEEKAGRSHCWNVMTPSKFSSFSIFVTKQYVPDGLLVLDHGWDLSFRRYQASLLPNPDDVTIKENGKKINFAELVGPEQNLTEMELDAYNLATRYFLKIGIAPPILPDLIFTTGIGVESIYGTLIINGERFQELAFSPHFFTTYEIVWARFMGKGSFSTYLDVQINETTNAGRNKSIKKDDMENFKINTASITLGLARLVFPM